MAFPGPAHVAAVTTVFFEIVHTGPLNVTGTTFL